MAVLVDGRIDTPGSAAVISGLLALNGRMGELKKVTRKIPEGQHEAGKVSRKDAVRQV